VNPDRRKTPRRYLDGRRRDRRRVVGRPPLVSHGTCRHSYPPDN